MALHRTKVEGVVELLSSLTAPYDPDGLDLYFSTEAGKQRPKSPEEFLRHLQDRPAKGLPDFRQRFATIIEKYQSKFGKTNTFSKWLHPKSMPSKGPRALSLYVLTDGIWDPNCTLITEVKNLVGLLVAHNSPNKHVGIQFIRFGNDAVGRKRLRHLDDKLGLELYVALCQHLQVTVIHLSLTLPTVLATHNILTGTSASRDTIDTTSADGNVWKMLLGAVNDWYDNDPDEDIDDEDELLGVQAWH